MNLISVVVSIFSMIAAIDLIFGNRFGLGKEFERGFRLLGTMALSMIGMITISPVIADIMEPCFNFDYEKLYIDPSIIPASHYANEMGGAPLAKEIAKDEQIGMFNALIVSSMMGCTVSFTIPFALGCVKKERQKELMLGLLCGIVRIPIGCFAAGLFSGLAIGELVIDLLPLILFAAALAGGLLAFPNACIKVFNVFGAFIKVIITIGLALGILKFLVGVEIIKGMADIEEGASICFNAAIVMSGAFPLIALLRKLLAGVLRRIGSKLQINDVSAMGFISTLATNATTFEMMNEMDAKGAVLNAAFAVSAAFTFASHLAFTLAFDSSYLSQMIIAKLISGFSALLFAGFVWKKNKRGIA